MMEPELSVTVASLRAVLEAIFERERYCEHAQRVAHELLTHLEARPRQLTLVKAVPAERLMACE